MVFLVVVLQDDFKLVTEMMELVQKKSKESVGGNKTSSSGTGEGAMMMMMWMYPLT